MQALDKKVGEYVVEDFRTAHIFSRYGIDFCCGGKKTLAEACRVASADAKVVIQELDVLEKSGGVKTLAENLSLAELIDYIVRVHHSYTREKGDLLLLYTQRMVNAHGLKHPEVIELEALVKSLVEEMKIHLLKEENILFPSIKSILAGLPSKFSKEQIQHPIQVMEKEHEDAGDVLKKISDLTNNFTPPEYACTTWKICYATLAEYQEDLHVHIHLENNILFPAISA